MPHPSARPRSVEEQLQMLQDEVVRLKERIANLEARIGQAPEHPVDQQMVRSKVAFDWQT